MLPKIIYTPTKSRIYTMLEPSFAALQDSQCLWHRWHCWPQSCVNIRVSVTLIHAVFQSRIHACFSHALISVSVTHSSLFQSRTFTPCYGHEFTRVSVTHSRVFQSRIHACFNHAFTSVSVKYSSVLRSRIHACFSHAFKRVSVTQSHVFQSRIHACFSLAFTHVSVTHSSVFQSRVPRNFSIRAFVDVFFSTAAVFCSMVRKLWRADPEVREIYLSTSLRPRTAIKQAF